MVILFLRKDFRNPEWTSLVLPRFALHSYSPVTRPDARVAALNCWSQLSIDAVGAINISRRTFKKHSVMRCRSRVTSYLVSR